MPLYEVEFTRTETWTVYAESRGEAEKAANDDTGAQVDALAYSDIDISVYGEHPVRPTSEVDAVVHDGGLVNPSDVGFDVHAVAEQEAAAKREADILARNLPLFDELLQE